jgi:glycosyltransferase involved in cell wall biosynthesis
MSHWQRLRAFTRFAWRAARRAASLEADLVFATSTPLTIALPAVYAARRTGCPMVFEVRDLWPAVPIAIGALRNPVAIVAARWLEKFAYRNASHVVALAPGMKDSIVATGYPPERVSVIPNGCDFDIFGDRGAGASELRLGHEWLGRRPLVVFTGTFGQVNGMSYLPRLAAAVSRVDQDVRFVALGSGREFAATRALAERLGVLDRQLFLLGTRPKVEAAEWVKAADMTLALFAGPEVVWRDAVQNKFFDSLAAGTPVANNFPGWQSIVAERAGAGLILSATDLDAAAADLVRHLRDESWMTRARLAARKLASETFDRDKLGAQLREVLERAAGAGA